PGGMPPGDGQIGAVFTRTKMLPSTRRHGTLHPEKARWVEKGRGRGSACPRAVSQTGTSATRATAPPTRLSQAPGAMLTYGHRTPENGRPLQPAARIA